MRESTGSALMLALLLRFTLINASLSHAGIAECTRQPGMQFGQIVWLPLIVFALLTGFYLSMAPT